jgi:hypothetical protein
MLQIKIIYSLSIYKMNIILKLYKLSDLSKHLVEFIYCTRRVWMLQLNSSCTINEYETYLDKSHPYKLTQWLTASFCPNTMYKSYSFYHK